MQLSPFIVSIFALSIDRHSQISQQCVLSLRCIQKEWMGSAKPIHFTCVDIVWGFGWSVVVCLWSRSVMTLNSSSDCTVLLNVLFKRNSMIPYVYFNIQRTSLKGPPQSPQIPFHLLLSLPLLTLISSPLLSPPHFYLAFTKFCTNVLSWPCWKLMSLFGRKGAPGLILFSMSFLL